VTTFVDSSGVYALLDLSDHGHTSAVRWFGGPGQDPAERLVTHNYVVVEALSLVHRRMGPAAARTMLEDVMPALDVIFVDRPIHERATSAFLLALRRRSISLVDLVSFEVMRKLGIEQAFAFDRDFEELGFRTVPLRGRLSRRPGEGSEPQPGGRTEPAPR
jgi:uncharacterized protein